jgi:ABC-type Mn2+/Zn2+ transport system permease subunit
METLREIFSPDFPLRNSIYASLLVGVACPLMGVFLVLRRMVFLGVALPQISSAGVAFAFALPAWGWFAQLHDTHAERALALGGSLCFTLLAILWLAWIERRGRTAIEARIGTAYALAGAGSILLLVVNPHGEHGMLELLRGEIIAVPDCDLQRAGVTFGLAAAGLLVFQKEFLLVAFDRDMAVTLGKRVLLWDLGLYALIGATVSVAVLIVGPLVTFGFLLMPGLLARHWARNLRSLLLIAVIAGAVGALAGFVLAYRLDWPVGPTDLLVLGVALGASSGLRSLVRGRA